MNPHELLYPLLNAKKRRYPFSHLYIEPFFSSDFYAEIEEKFPSKEAFDIAAKTKNLVAGYSEKRGVLPLTKEKVGTLPEEISSFWEGVRRLLLDGHFGEAVLAFFHDEVREAIKGAKLIQSAELVLDSGGYALDVHTDHPSKLITLIFYLPEDDSLKEAGTALFAPKKELPKQEGYSMYPESLFDHVATMPFVPNSLFGFVRTDSSWHGVREVQKEAIERRSLCYRIVKGK